MLNEQDKKVMTDLGINTGTATTEAEALSVFLADNLKNNITTNVSVIGELLNKLDVRDAYKAMKSNFKIETLVQHNLDEDPQFSILFANINEVYNQDNAGKEEKEYEDKSFKNSNI